MELREKLVDAMWATLFAKDESPEVIASFKERWPEDLVSSNRRADAALKVFAEWLESDEAMKVIGTESQWQEKLASERQRGGAFVGVDLEYYGIGIALSRTIRGE
tara:strand:+ start:3647 stop:3961 length:315 start_codon:yes stop_codon:yes gene_type:complete